MGTSCTNHLHHSQKNLPFGCRWKWMTPEEPASTPFLRHASPRAEVAAKADKHYSTSKFHAQPYEVGKVQLPEDLRALYKPRIQTRKTTDDNGSRVHSSLLLSARHKSMGTGPYFWDRHPSDISAHAIPPGQHLAPPSPAVTSVVTLCWVSKRDSFSWG